MVSLLHAMLMKETPENDLEDSDDESAVESDQLSVQCYQEFKRVNGIEAIDKIIFEADDRTIQLFYSKFCLRQDDSEL